MDICMIAAVSMNRVIGNEGKIPWHIKKDFQFFKDITGNSPMIMGAEPVAPDAYTSLSLKVIVASKQIA